MDTYVLATRLRIPPQTHHTVRRVRLVDTLEQGIAKYRLTLVSAPAGYGKTTLLSQWAQTTHFPVVWFSISAEDNDPHRFFRYLVTAWKQVEPEIRQKPLGLLLDSMQPDMDAVLSAFLSAASALPDHTVFVLDDVHLVEDPALWNALTSLLDRLPPTAHFVFSGRGEPPLPLARYRARNELLELGMHDLAFQPDETSAFLGERMSLTLGPDEIQLVHRQLEGWITGLQLMALALRRHPDGADRLRVSGRHRFIADYLHEDVLEHLPEDVRSFLLQTSILDRLSGALCDAVTGRSDSQQTLEQLERDSLFLMPLDASREWYRYHRLFADVLSEGLQRDRPGEVADLHRRAAQWYLAHDLPEQAFNHVLAAGDLDLMIEIGERYIFALLHSGEFRILEQWLTALPEAWYAAYPTFKLAQASLLAFSGAIDECVTCIDDAEQMLGLAPLEDSRPHLARVTAMRCFLACMQNDIEQAETYAGEALRELATEDISFRADIYHALGDTYRHHGRWQDARNSYLRVLNFTRSPTFPALSVHVFGALADLELRQGHLSEAATYWRMALATIQARENRGRFPLPVSGWVYIRLGEILYEWNELRESWAHLSHGLELAELGGDVRAMTAGYLLAARVKLTEGDIEAASAYLAQARPLVEQASMTDWIGRFERLQIELWLAQGKLQAAVRWADEALEEGPESEVAGLAVARVLIARGDLPAVERALSLIGPLLQSAQAEGRTGIVIEALALQSLAHWQRGERAAGLTSLQQALQLAEPQGYVRLFADLGLPMVRLLQEAHSRQVMPDYVSTLLAACGAVTPPGNGPLPEPLTPREQEILQLIAAGLTNQEIGNRLFISPQTVKKHTGNIYGKLSVHTRTEAAARARALDLLG